MSSFIKYLNSTIKFEKVFPEVITGNDKPAEHATLQSLVVAIYVCIRTLCEYSAQIYHFSQEIGCLIGALSNLYIGDKLGRRRTIALGGVIMIIGAILQTASFSYAQMIVARIVTGFGNGLNASSLLNLLFV